MRAFWSLLLHSRVSFMRLTHAINRIEVHGRGGFWDRLGLQEPAKMVFSLGFPVSNGGT